MAKNTEKGRDGLLLCNFCGRSQHEVRRLIAGPDAFICDECVDLCIDILIDGNPELLPSIHKLIKGNQSSEIDLALLGVKPRFNKLRFTQKKNHIFYLCPFSEPFDTIYADHVKPTVISGGFTIERADEIYGTQPIIEDIWESINSAEIIIADATDRNPNVMYEVGMAHTVGKPVLIITQDINDVPFDLKHHRCLIYSHTPRGCKLLEEKIRSTLTFLLGKR